MACLLFLLSSNLFCAETLKPLSLFQNQIKDCGFEFEKIRDIKTHSQLYSEASKKFALRSEKTIYRELYFRVKNETRKIKITNDTVELFKIGEEDRHTPLNIEARQKYQTLQSQISQLTLNTKIENDWQKIEEIRNSGVKIEIVRVDQKITQLKMNIDKSTKSLDCQLVNVSEICLCNK